MPKQPNQQANEALTLLRESGILNTNATLEQVMNLANKVSKEKLPPGLGGHPSTELKIYWLFHRNFFLIGGEW